MTLTDPPAVLFWVDEKGVIQPTYFVLDAVRAGCQINPSRISSGLRRGGVGWMALHPSTGSGFIGG
jgi:hypothetical protein